MATHDPFDGQDQDRHRNASHLSAADEISPMPLADRSGKLDWGHFNRFPVSKRGTLHSGFDESQPLNTVFDGWEWAIDLVARFMPHPCNDGSRKVGVEVSKRFKVAFGMADLHARHQPGGIANAWIFPTRHGLRKTVPFPMNQAIRLFLVPFDTKVTLFSVDIGFVQLLLISLLLESKSR
jgi:hypothetical protein